MTTEPDLDNYLGSLRRGLPSATDEARIRQRLSAAGLAVGVALASQTAAASSVASTQLGFMSILSIRFASLPLIAQMGLITAGTTVVASIPIVAITHVRAETTRHVAPLAAPVVEHAAASIPLVPASPAPKREAAPTDFVRSGSTMPTAPSARGASTSVQVPTSVQAPSPTQLEATPGQRMATRGVDLEDGAHDEPRPTAVDQEPAAPAVQSVAPESTLARETRLIDAALLAIRDGNFALANQRLVDHARLFPTGRLTQERLRAQQQLAAATRRGNLD